MNGPDLYLGVREQMEERNELMRRAALSALQRSNNGKTLDPEARRWAEWWASIPPLTRPLSSGDPL